MSTIILIHGIGGHAWSFTLLEIYLKMTGNRTFHYLEYPSDKETVDELMDYIDVEMLKVVTRDEPVYIIGQSMGGFIGMNIHKYGYNIQQTITIGSPLHGARFVRHCENMLPRFVVGMLERPLYHHLKLSIRMEEPPHPYHTITLGWFFSGFDGCVFRDEGMFSEETNTHLCFADHRTIFANPRLGYHVNRILADYVE